MKMLLLAEVSAELVIGGAERVLRNEALGLAALGHHVELMTRAPEKASRGMIEVHGIREWRYPVSRTHEAAFVWSSLRQSVLCFDRLRTTEPLDVAIIHQSMAGLGPIVFRRHAASQWVYLCHSLAHEEYDTRQPQARSGLTGLRRTLNLHARRAVERAVISRCDRVVVLSQFMRQRAMKAHGISAERIGQIAGAVDPRTFACTPDRRLAKTVLNLPSDRTILFTVRNLVSRMGLENLLNALEMLRVARRDVLLVIGGEGPLRKQLHEDIRRKGLHDCVRLTGFIPEEQLTHYYQAADLVVVPSLQLEGFGLVIVEAMACGTPVVGTPIGAIPEILNQVHPILVADGTDGPSIARALERVLRHMQDPGEAARLARKGRELVEHRYNWSNHCADLVRLLEEPAPLRLAA